MTAMDTADWDAGIKMALRILRKVGSWFLTFHCFHLQSFFFLLDNCRGGVKRENGMQANLHFWKIFSTISSN